MPQPDYFKRNEAWAKKGPYQTRLHPIDEASFRSWVKLNKIPFNSREKNPDYDMRGFYAALRRGDPRATTGYNKTTQSLHFTDRWKTPYHKSFSNESTYATPDAPRWKGDSLYDKGGKLIYAEQPPAKAKK